MKTTNKAIAIVIFSILSILSTFINSGCGTDSITGTGFTGHVTASDAPDSITITVTKLSGGFEFNLQNRTNATIVNDFHVQFDTTVSIIDWGLYWQFDNNSTNLSKGKIGEKAAPGQQPISPGQQHFVLWVKIQQNGRKINKAFNWQATRDGIVVQSGTSTLPD